MGGICIIGEWVELNMYNISEWNLICRIRERVELDMENRREAEMSDQDFLTNVKLVKQKQWTDTGWDCHYD